MARGYSLGHRGSGPQPTCPVRMPSTVCLMSGARRAINLRSVVPRGTAATSVQKGVSSSLLHPALASGATSMRTWNALVAQCSLRAATRRQQATRARQGRVRLRCSECRSISFADRRTQPSPKQQQQESRHHLASVPSAATTCIFITRSTSATPAIDRLRFCRLRLLKTSTQSTATWRFCEEQRGSTRLRLGGSMFPHGSGVLCRTLRTGATHGQGTPVRQGRTVVTQSAC